MWGAVCLWLVTSWVGWPELSAQTYAEPICRSAVPDRIELEISDRYRLPVPDAEVHLAWSPYGFYHPFAGSEFAEPETARATTDRDGLVSIQLPEDELASALVSKGGYAPSLAYPLHAGWRYRVQLDLGSRAEVLCVDANGQPVSDTRVTLKWNSGIRAFPGQHLGQESWAGGDGGLGLEYLPRGQFELIAHSPTAGMAQLDFQVFNAFGREPSLSLSDMKLNFAEPVEYRLQVVDLLDNQPVVGLIADVEGFYHLDPQPKAVVNGDEVRFGPVPAGMQWIVNLMAPGYESVEVDLSEAMPAVVKLRPVAHRKLRFRPAEGSADCAIYVARSCLGFGGWWRLPPKADGSFEVEGVPESVDVFGVAIRDGRIRAYLSSTGEGLHWIRPGGVEVRYSVGGRSPVGALVRVNRIQEEAEAQAPCHDLRWTGRLVPTDPDGRLVLHDLMPGRYELEPHLHFSVFSDSVGAFTVEEGRVLQYQIEVRPGVSVRGRVVDARNDQPLRNGFVVAQSSEGHPEHYPVFPVAADGRFIAAGLAPDRSYLLSYETGPWFGFPTYVAPEGKPPFAFGEVLVDPPFSQEVLIRVHFE